MNIKNTKQQKLTHILEHICEDKYLRDQYFELYIRNSPYLSNTLSYATRYCELDEKEALRAAVCVLCVKLDQLTQ